MGVDDQNADQQIRQCAFDRGRRHGDSGMGRRSGDFDQVKRRDDAATSQVITLRDAGDGEISDGPSAVGKRVAWTAGALVAGLALTIGVPMGLVALVPSYDPGPMPDSGADVGGVVPIDATTVPLSGSDPASIVPASRTKAPAAVPSAVARSSARPAAGGTYEAEASSNTLGGSAWVIQYPGASGGRIVRNIGAWDSRHDGAGWLRFNDVTVPADGTYTMTIYTTHPDGELTRNVVVEIGGGARGIITLKGDRNCCSAAKIKVGLKKGQNTITFSNPREHAPAIDRISIATA